jgi:outer membrane protein
MRTLGLLALGLGLLWSVPAHAQFQNHSLGLRLGYIQESSDLNLNSTFPIPAFGINGTLYIEHGIDVGLAFDFGIQTNHTSKSQDLVLYPSAVMRYFLFEDYLRPYVGLELSYIHIFFDSAPNGTTNVATDNLIGLGALIGVEYSFTDQLSIGGQIELVVLSWLNSPTILEPRGFVRLATHF